MYWLRRASQMNKLHKTIVMLTSIQQHLPQVRAEPTFRIWLQIIKYTLCMCGRQSSQFTQVHIVLLPSCSLSSAHICTCVAYMWGFIPLNPHIGQSFSGSMEIATFGRLCQMCRNHCIIIILQTQLVSHLILYLLIHNSSSTRRHLSPGYL